MQKQSHVRLEAIDLFSFGACLYFMATGQETNLCFELRTVDGQILMMTMVQEIRKVC